MKYVEFIYMQQKDRYLRPRCEISSSRELRRASLISLGNEPEHVDFLLKISYWLTPLGFECFVAYFLELHYGYKTTVQGGYYDEWIDIKWVRIVEDGKREYAAVQCKNWNAQPLRLANVAEFYGRVADIRHTHKNTQLFYASTGYFTSPAKDFLDEKDIVYMDFDTFLNSKEYITKEGFYEYLKRHDTEYVEHNKDKHQTQIYIETHRDVFEHLKRVRKELSIRENIPVYAVASNHQLADFIKHRPVSMNEFVGLAGFNEKQVHQYAWEFIKVFQRTEIIPKL